VRGREGRQNRDPERERTCADSSFVPVHFWTLRRGGGRGRTEREKERDKVHIRPVCVRIPGVSGAAVNASGRDQGNRASCYFNSHFYLSVKSKLCFDQ